MQNIYSDDFASQVGRVLVKANKEAVLSISFYKKGEILVSNEITDLCIKELVEYFKGKRKEFTFNFSLEGTDFQKKVWEKLREIPYGETASYKDIAEKIGNPEAFRAVGNAVAKNPLIILVPCHRVISVDGNLSGYAYGVEKKRFLLELEKRMNPSL